MNALKGAFPPSWAGMSGDPGGEGDADLHASELIILPRVHGDGSDEADGGEKGCWGEDGDYLMCTPKPLWTPAHWRQRKTAKETGRRWRWAVRERREST